MKLVAIARAPSRPEEAARAVADAAGLTLAEARMLLAPEPPALLARLEPDKANALVGALRKAGLAALAVDTPCPTDKDRTLARSFSIHDRGVTFTPRFGKSMEVGWADVLAILRGLRKRRTEVERTETTTKLSPGTAVLTGGLMLTESSTKTMRSSEEANEQVILVYARGGRAATLAESQLDYSCLGADMQPSTTGNMVELARLLRERAKRAFYDERLLRLGRRPLPFLVGGESRSQTATVTKTLTDTSGSLDTLAEVLRRALMEGLLP
jgi:hypothetical protein